MDKLLQSQWDARRAPIVTCVHYQTSSLSYPQRYRLNLVVDGIELHTVANDTHSSGSASLTAGLFSRKTKRDAVEIIPWSDVLGADIVNDGLTTNDPLADDTANGVTMTESVEVEFTVHGCINKGRSAKRMHGASASASTRGDKHVHEEPVERMMGHWTFRYSEPDAVKKIPHVVSLIRTMADPRTNSDLANATMGVALPRRKYLVYVNPVGGAGRAKQLYSTVVAPVFQQSNIECEAVITEHQGHATEHVMEIPLDTYDCVVAVGGDGLLSEILQGIMKRQDWKRAIRQPLGIIPGGSGNGLSVSLLARSNERSHVLNAAYSLAKGTVQDIDISTVLNSHQEVMYSFLSLEWAFIADVDIESERYRMFGGLRFTISAVAKIIGAPLKNSGKLRYLSSENDSAPPPKYHERDHGFEDELAPAFDCFASRPEQKEPHVKGEWKEVEGDFHLFWCMNVTHAASDAHVAPGAVIDDGYYHLVVAPAFPSRIELAKLLLSIENGSHVNNKGVQVIRTRAFTLEVDNPADLVVVDGERFKGPKVQVEVHRGLGRVICLPRCV